MGSSFLLRTIISLALISVNSMSQAANNSSLIYPPRSIFGVPQSSSFPVGFPLLTLDELSEHAECPAPAIEHPQFEYVFIFYFDAVECKEANETSMVQNVLIETFEPQPLTALAIFENSIQDSCSCPLDWNQNSSGFIPLPSFDNNELSLRALCSLDDNEDAAEEVSDVLDSYDKSLNFVDVFEVTEITGEYRLVQALRPLVLGIAVVLCALYFFIICIIAYVFIHEFFDGACDADFRDLLHQIQAENARRHQKQSPMMKDQSQQTDVEIEPVVGGECSAEADVSMDDTLSHSCA